MMKVFLLCVCVCVCVCLYKNFPRADKSKKWVWAFTFTSDVGSEPFDGAVEGQAAGAGESERVVARIALILQLRIQREAALLQRGVVAGVLDHRRLSAVSSVGHYMIFLKKKKKKERKSDLDHVSMWWRFVDIDGVGCQRDWLERGVGVATSPHRINTQLRVW